MCDTSEVGPGLGPGPFPCPGTTLLHSVLKRSVRVTEMRGFIKVNLVHCASTRSGIQSLNLIILYSFA